jgi:release factor glutamine methyltransferase
MSELWTVKKLLDWSDLFLKKKGISSSKYNAQILLSYVLEVPKLELFLQFTRELSQKELAQYKELITKRINHEPLQYIVGYTEFLGMKVNVDKNVLIPRFETEELVIKAQKYIKKTSGIALIADIGTGSGAIAIYLKKQFPDTQVIATDISEDALNVAKKNAELNKVKIDFFSETFPDINLSEITHVFIITNPPYIKNKEIESLDEEVKKYEPRLALDGGEDGFEVIKKILLTALNLKNNVTIFMEIGYNQAEDLEYLCESLLINDIVFFEDINHVQRIAKIDIKNY